MTPFWRSLMIAGVAVGVFLGVIVGPAVYRFISFAIETPSDDDAGWASKLGWRLCNSAIGAWPRKPAPACWKLAICDNEGSLSANERKRLDQMLAKANCDDR
jgi:hypothetical protein